MTEVEKLRQELEELRLDHANQAKKLSVERENLSRLFENSSGFFAVMKGPQHIYQYVNRAHKNIVGDDFTGKPILEVVPKAALLHKVVNQVYETGESILNQELPVTIKNEIHYMNANYIATKNEHNEVDGVMAWGIDITEEVISRRNIEESNQALHAERQMRERFVIALTHDLRTPITSIRLSADQLAKKSNDPVYIQNVARRILKTIDRSEQMIVDLLDASRIQAGEGVPLKLEEFYLPEIIDSIVHELSNIYGARFIFVDKMETLPGFWDKTALQRVLENLIGNALKYGKEKAPVTITLDKEDQYVYIRVHNEGNPISLEDQSKIFRPYQRTEDAKVGNHQGWGIGLTLVQAITEAHGGVARVESSELHGTTFIIKIPMNSSSK